MGGQDQSRKVPPDSMAELTSRLRKRSRRVTGPRQVILEALGKERRPMTVQEIRRKLPRTGCNLVTIYRAVAMLTELKLVQRFDFGDGVARFELIGEHGHDHHHHLVCRRCTRIIELEECFPAEWEQAIAKSHDFTGVTHRLEFFGVCPACQ